MSYEKKDHSPETKQMGITRSNKGGMRGLVTGDWKGRESRHCCRGVCDQQGGGWRCAFEHITGQGMVESCVVCDL